MSMLSGLSGSSSRRGALLARHGHSKWFALALVFVVLSLTVMPVAAQHFAEAAAAGDLSIVRALLADGVDLNSDTEPVTGKTALMTASNEGHVEIVQVLLAAGPEIEATDSEGFTALYWATRGHHEGIVRILVAAGANVNAIMGRWNITPLMFATFSGQEEVKQILVAAGANPLPTRDALPERDEWLFELASGETVKIEEGMTQRQINSILGNVIGPLQLRPSLCHISIRSDLGSFAFDGDCRLRNFTGRR